MDVTRVNGESAEELNFSVSGMSCASCVSHVEKAVRALPDVIDVDVNLVTESARVRLVGANAQSDVTTSSILHAIEEAGYGASLIPPTSATTTEPHVAPDGAPTALGRTPEAQVKRDLWTAGLLAIPLLALGMSHLLTLLPNVGEHGLGIWIRFTESRAALWLQAGFALLILVFPGRKFFRLGFLAAKHRYADMNTLVALGAGSAFIFSLLSLLGITPSQPFSHHGMQMVQAPVVYFEAAGTIVFFVLIGKWLESKAKRRLLDGVSELVRLAPPTAHLLVNNLEKDVPSSELKVGDVVRVRPGERLAADGQVFTGEPTIDESMLTGESAAVSKQVGARVFAGTLNQVGIFEMKVTQAPGGTVLDQIVRSVTDAQGKKAPIARLADQISAYFVPVVLLIALVTLVVWTFVVPSGSIAIGVERLVAVLVLACPCALGLATPAAIAVGTSRAAELGVLFRDGGALERTAKLERLVLDKTGTLTVGAPQVTAVVAAHASIESAEVIRLAVALESLSEHPLARAVVRYASEKRVTVSRATDVQPVAGGGLTGTVDGSRVSVGSLKYLEGRGVKVDVGQPDSIITRHEGETAIWVAKEDVLLGAVLLADEVDESSAPGLHQLSKMGIAVQIASGDRNRVVADVARQLSVEVHQGELTPQGKLDLLAALKKSGHRVGMVGDGINDAPALATADVGIAMGNGADVAIGTADVVLVKGKIGGLVRGIQIARSTMRTIHQNLFWAFAYNVIGIPLAAGVFAAVTDFRLSPMWASAAMSLSSVSVVLNSLLLRRK